MSAMVSCGTRRSCSALAARITSVDVSARARAISSAGAGTLDFTSSVPCMSYLATPRSKQIEIFLLLPFGHFRVVARELGSLDGEIVVDESLSETFGKAAILGERSERLLERLGQGRCLRFVRCIRRRSGIELTRNAIAAGDDLRGHVEIRIRGRLTDAVFEPRRLITLPAKRTDHYAAIVVAPDHAIGRQRIGAIALVAVDRRRREGRCCTRMRKQPAQEVARELRQRLVRRHEGIRTACLLAQ